MKPRKETIKKIKMALEITHMNCNTGKKFSIDKICQSLRLTREFSGSLFRLGIITKQDGVYKWIYKTEPTDELVDMVYFEKANQKPIIETFQNDRSIEEQIDHLEFMLDRVFERVNFMFENLYGKEVFDSEWSEKK